MLRIFEPEAPRLTNTLRCRASPSRGSCDPHCGLALPPVAIHQPGPNEPQPADGRLGPRLLHLVGDWAAITSSTAVSMAPVSVTCYEARSATPALAGRRPRSRTISNRSLAILPEMDGVLDQLDDAAELVGRQRANPRCHRPRLVQRAQQIVDDPVWRPSCRRGLSATLLKNISAIALSETSTEGVIGPTGRASGISRAFLVVRQLRQAFRQRIDNRPRSNSRRQQVGIGEIAIVMRLFLGTHGAGLALVRVEQPRLLVDSAAIFEDRDLAPRLVLDRLVDEADRIDVLESRNACRRCSPGPCAPRR